MLVKDGNVYGDRISEEDFDQFIDQAYADEAIRNNLLVMLNTTMLSVKALSKKTGLKPDVIFRHILILVQKGQVEMARVEGHSPLYRSTISE